MAESPLPTGPTLPLPVLVQFEPHCTGTTPPPGHVPSYWLCSSYCRKGGRLASNWYAFMFEHLMEIIDVRICLAEKKNKLVDFWWLTFEIWNYLKKWYGKDEEVGRFLITYFWYVKTMWRNRALLSSGMLDWYTLPCNATLRCVGTKSHSLAAPSHFSKV